MNEEEWLTCDDSSEMLVYLRDGGASERKLRLFACACCRRIWGWVVDDRFRRAVQVAEAFADGLVNPIDLEEARSAADERLRAGVVGPTVQDAYSAVCWASAPLMADTDVARFTAKESDYLALIGVSGLMEQSDLVRDIFGNPFRPKPEVAPEWLAWKGGTVRRLAQAIYDERAFDRLPILADALEEAGCADAALLEHCRGDSPHVRGCWVVDLLLGKE